MRRMICKPCRVGKEKEHFCVNDWHGDDPITKRDEPIKACACQHRKSAVFVTIGSKKTKDTFNGDGS